MAFIDYEVHPIEPSTVTEEQFNALFDIEDSLLYEDELDDKPHPRELRKKMMQRISDESQTFRWLALSKKTGQGIGYAQATIATEQALNFDTAKNLAGVTIEVIKDFRGQGLGTRLLCLLLDKINEYGCVTTIGVFGVHQRGARFCEKFNGKVVQEENEFRLYFSDIDWELIANWQKAGEQRVKEDGIILHNFEFCPDDLLEGYAALYTEIINQRPLGEITVRHRITPESHRERVRLLITERGHKLFTLVTQEADDSLSGLTEMVFIPESDYYIEQLLTGVREPFRNRGLGKWLKAEMISFIHKQHPSIKFIVTDNATTNAPMLSINERLGFKEFLSYKTYHFQAADLNRLIL